MSVMKLNVGGWLYLIVYAKSLFFSFRQRPFSNSIRFGGVFEQS